MRKVVVLLKSHRREKASWQCVWACYLVGGGVSAGVGQIWVDILFLV